MFLFGIKLVIKIFFSSFQSNLSLSQYVTHCQTDDVRYQTFA